MNHEDAFLLLALTMVLAFVAGIQLADWVHMVTTGAMESVCPSC